MTAIEVSIWKEDYMKNVWIVWDIACEKDPIRRSYSVDESLTLEKLSEVEWPIYVDIYVT